MPSVLAKLNGILRPNGLIYMGLKEGDHEGCVESDKYPGSKRYFAYYREEELKTLISNNLDIVYNSKSNPSFGMFLNYIARKR